MSNEYKKLQKQEVNEFQLKPVDDTLKTWTATMRGPEDTPYEGGSFELNIKIPQMYPFVPPKFQFMTKLYHPNIDTEGNICLDILKNHWSASLTLEKVLYSISSLLNDPNPDDPLRSDVAKLYKTDRKKYNEMAKQHMEKYSIRT